MKKIVFVVLFATSVVSATEIASGFDYPIGSRGYDSSLNKVSIDEHIKDFGNGYNVDRNEEYNLRKGVSDNNARGGNWSSSWYNISDVGNFLNLEYTYGLHSGEDWNKGSGTDDVGEPIYAVANGVVKYIKTVYSNTTKYGWTVVLEHTLPDESKIYSVYTHITYDASNLKGVIAKKADQFTYKTGDLVEKGEVIGRIANITGMSPHLHFEIRDKISSNLYPNDNGNGYYTHNNKKLTTMTKDQVLEAFDLMRQDGILDPSDFIDDHRSISDNANKPIITGVGSIINPDKLNGCWGCNKDEAIMQKHDSPSVILFQWQKTNSCPYLNIGVQLSSSTIKDNDNIKVKVLTKSWKNETATKAFETTFPITVENVSNDNWNNIAIASISPMSEAKSIIAVCSTTPTYQNRSKTTLNETKVESYNNYFWAGNSSIIRRDNPNSTQEDAIYQDIAIGSKTTKASTYFQWEPTQECSKLELKNTSGYKDETSVNTNIGAVNMKVWDARWKAEESDLCNQVLPCTIDLNKLGYSSTSYLKTYYIIRVQSDAGAITQGNISAKCK